MDMSVYDKNTKVMPISRRFDMSEIFSVKSQATSAISPKDFALIRKTSNGVNCLELSLDPFSTTDTASIVSFNNAIALPVMADLELSISQRIKGQYFIAELSSTDTSSVDLPTEFNITAISQSASVLTVTIDEAFDGYLGSWVDIYGMIDSRFNYTNLAVASISNNKKVLTFTVGDEAPIVALTASPAGGFVGGKLKRQAKLLSASDAVALRFSGSSATSGAVMVRCNGGSIKEFGSLVGSRLVTIASTTPTYTSGQMGQVEIKAQTKYKIDIEQEQVTVLDKAIDASASWSPRAVSSGVVPILDDEYFFRLRGVNPKSTTTVIGEITAIAKSGSAIATVTVPNHGLTVNSFVFIKGVRDFTNFANINTTPVQVASVIDANRFTISFSLSATANSFGGVVLSGNGSIDNASIQAQVIQSISSDADGVLQVVGSANWTLSNANGLGEYVTLYGVRDALGNAVPNVGGTYKIVNITTNTMSLKNVTNYDETPTLAGVVNPANVDEVGTSLAPVIPVSMAPVNCGGVVVLRSTLRLHNLAISSYSAPAVRIEGQGSNRIDKAIPALLVGGSTTVSQPTAASLKALVDQGAVATLAADGTGGWYVRPGIQGVVDVASAAITTTATTSSIANNLGNGFQVSIAVTTVTGTTPTLDVRVEESFDGGTNWVTLYEMQRITATGSYNSPILRATGRHIRYVQTVAGTTPSFTRAITRNVLPFIQAEPQKRLMDRSIVLTTLNSVTPTLFSGAANNLQLIVNLGTATTPPALQLEGSEDGVNFYSIGSPLTGVASSTVQLTVTGLSATFVRARVSTVGATVVAGYVSIKAWS